MLGRGAGVILGKIFNNADDIDGTRLDSELDNRESELLVKSGGRRLVDEYWGHYVAFLRSPEDRALHILRDPTGGLPCFVVRTGGIHIVLSDVEDCVRLELTPFDVDWDYITAFFLHPRLVTRTTGFRELTQVYAGECATVKYDKEPSQVSRSFYWNPISVYERGPIDDPDVALRAIRGSIRQCVKGWASSYRSIVHELSGGLDSAIVAACLADAHDRPQVACFHYFTETSEGDERTYARSVAQSTGFELIESEVNNSKRPLQSLFDTTRFASPAMTGFLPTSEVFRQQLVGERRAGAVFSGQGGDQLFQEERSKLLATEYARRHGMRTELLSVAKDTSRLTRQSVWSVLFAMARHEMLGQVFDPYTFHFQPPAVLTEDAQASLRPDAYTHPWVQSAVQLPASKIQHVFNIVDCQPFQLMPCPDAEQIHPLISQPVLEVSLRTPCYVLAYRGRPRGLVRKAFESDIPARVFQRASKGGTTSYWSRLLIDNAAFLRELLLDGRLVEEGILDRQELENLLSERGLIRGKGQRAVLCSVIAEAWLETWAGV